MIVDGLRTLYYGDNLDVLRKYIRDETIDLCYIDPPFNSQRNYYQIYNNIGSEDRAQAFTDTWVWNDRANEEYAEILGNEGARYQAQTIELIKGLRNVLGMGSLLAYLVSMTRRIAEIHRKLKPTGSFYLHCDPTSSHYLKIVLDAVFCSQGGDLRNEIIWYYGAGGRGKRHFGRKHDTIFFYSKSDAYTFNGDAVRVEMKAGKSSFGGRLRTDEDGRVFREVWGTGGKKLYRYYLDEGKIPEDVWEIPSIQSQDAERLGYPTQKPETLLERIIAVGSDEGDVILDAYCGCGTSVAVAERLKRQWIGIDITYQAIAVILKRLEDQTGTKEWAALAKRLILHGIPRDMDSASALANKKDDRVRKEFEKWAVLTYSNNRGTINDKKGADAGMDGTVYFMTSATDNAKMVFQVKSGGALRGDIAKLRGDMDREGAAMATFITLEKPTAPVIAEAKGAGRYHHTMMGRDYDAIQIVTVQEIIEKGRRLDLPMSHEVLKTAARAEEEADAPTISGIDLSPVGKRHK